MWVVCKAARRSSKWTAGDADAIAVVPTIRPTIVTIHRVISSRAFAPKRIA